MHVAWTDRLRTLSPPLLSSHREFARWKVNNLALERKDFFSLPLRLAPEFIRNIRLLGRRPSSQQITDSLIKKYGTHFLLAATLGGECWWVLTPRSLPARFPCTRQRAKEGGWENKHQRRNTAKKGNGGSPAAPRKRCVSPQERSP